MQRWLTRHERITSGDLATLTALSVPTARVALDRLVGEGVLARGDAVGRNAHYRPGRVTHAIPDAGAAGAPPPLATAE